MACATPARSAPAPRRFCTDSDRSSAARRGTAPQKSRKRFKHLAARVVCGVGAHAARSLKHTRARTRLPETRQQESRAIPRVATYGRMVSTSDMPNAESALKPGRIFLADGPAGTLGRCWKPLARPRSAGGAPATWPAAWSEAPPAAMAAREMATCWCLHYHTSFVWKLDNKKIWTTPRWRPAVARPCSSSPEASSA